MSKKSKLLAVFLAAVMTLLSLPMNVFAEYFDEVFNFAVERIEFEPTTYRLIEGVNGEMCEEYDEETGDYVEYFRYYGLNPIWTAYLSNGDQINGHGWGWTWYNGDSYYMNINMNQSPSSPWGVGTHMVEAEFMGYKTAFEVEVIPSPVVSLEFEPIRIIEGTNGYIRNEYDWETDTEVEYYYYDIEYAAHSKWTATLADGSVHEGGGLIEYDDIYYGMGFYTDQSADSPWGVGMHTATAEIMGFKTTVDVEIIETPIERIEFDPVTLVENSNGYMTEDYNPDTDTYEEYFCYYYTPNFTVYFKDGTSEKIYNNGINFNDDYYRFLYNDDQGPASPWGLGTHTVEAEIMNYKTSFDVEVVSTPIVSLVFDPIEVIEGTKGYTRNEYDWETGEAVEYYYYDVQYDAHPKWTAVMSDGSVLEGYGSFDYNGEWYGMDFSTGQSAASPWGVGDHTVTVTVMGYTTEFNVKIIQSPVVSLEVEPVQLILNADGEYRDGYDYDIHDYVEYYRYYYNYIKWTAHLSDGTVIEGDGQSSVDYNGYSHYVSIYDDQSVSSPWGLGNHTATAELMGFKTTFEVEIVETPVERVEVEPLVIMENTNGYMMRDEYNYETGEYDTFFYYLFYPTYTVYFKDGTVKKGSGRKEYYNGGGSWSIGDGISYNDRDYLLEFKGMQSAASPWGVGVHTVEAEIMGCKTSFDVEIISSPVVSLEVEPVQIIEGANGYYTYEYDYASGEYKQYFYYNISPKWKAVLVDGTVVEKKGSDYINYNGSYYYVSFSTYQSYSNQWGVGKHTAEAGVLGYTTSFEVEILPSPYVSLEVVLMSELRENTNCYKSSDGTVRYDRPRFFYKVIRNDGTYVTGYCTGSSTGALVVSDNQANEPWTVGGNNIMTVEYLNLKTEVNVEIKSTAPYDYIEQNGGLYITNCRVFDDTVEIPAEIDGKTVKGILSLGRTIFSAKNIVIPDTVETISADVFTYSSNKLETMTIGSGLKYIDAKLFAKCNNLKSITVSKDNAYYCDIDGVVYNKSADTLIVYPLAQGSEYTVPASVKDFSIINELPCYSKVNVILSDNSADFKTVDGVTYNADMTKIIKCNPDKSGNYVMPETVTDIMPEAFRGCVLLEGVEFSSKIAGIVYRSFADCTALKSVKLPENLVSIGVGAFENCTSLNNVVLPNSLETIGEKAFCDCTDMSTVTFGEGLKTIDARAFDYCPLESIVLHEGIESIGDYAFRGTAIKTVSLPHGDIKLGVGIFSCCANIESFDLGDAVSIPSQTFQHGGFKVINIPNGIESIGEWAFYDCSKAEALNISDTVKQIGNWAFYYCKAITELALPANVEELGNLAFYGCKSLTSLTVENKNLVLGISAFSGCALTQINLPIGFTNISEYAFRGNDIEKLRLPDSVTRIAYGAFESCSNLYDVQLPEDLVAVGAHAFDKTKWYSDNKADITYLSTILYEANNAAGEYVVADGTTVIADYAFDNSKITGVVLPDGLKGIGARAFLKTDITEISIPASVSYIGEYAFAACKNLTAINVDPDNEYYKSVNGVLYTKDGSVLVWCPKLDCENYVIPYGVKTVKSGAFTYSNVTNITVNDPETEFEAYSVGYNGYLHEDRGGVFEWRQEAIVYANIICLLGSKAAEYGEENFVKITIADGCEHETMVQETVEASYREQGYTLHTCTICGYSYADNYTELRQPTAGDTDGDGKINAKDSNYMKQILLGNISANESEVIAADINCDGVVNTKDAFALKNMILGR